MTGPRRRWRWFGGLAGAGFALWLGGFAWFVHDGLSAAASGAAHTDAIVVLTGGRARLETGFDLFGQGKARKLFISGVNQRVDRAMLLHRFEPVADRARCCVVIGHDADNTYGNARETAAWMRREGFTSLRLVTSWYHMPRSLLEFRRAMPGIAIIASPVFATGDEHEGRAAAWLDAAVLTIGEYDKFLAVWLRPAAASVWPGLAPPALSDRPATTTAAASAPPH